MDFILFGAGSGFGETSSLIHRNFSNANIIGSIVSNIETESNKKINLYTESFLANKKDINFVLAVGNPVVRLSIGKTVSSKYPNINLINVIDKSALIDNSASFGYGNVVSIGAIVSNDVNICNYSWICAGAIIGHNSIINNGSVIFPGSIISGCVEIGAGTMIGAGSRILPGISIGDFCKVGAGAVVINNIPSHTTVVGIPAKEKRKHE